MMNHAGNRGNTLPCDIERKKKSFMPPILHLISLTEKQTRVFRSKSLIT